MQTGLQKRTFARGTAVAEANAFAKDFDAIFRIQNIRQTLCSIVSSRAASSQCASTPRDETPYNMRGLSTEGTVMSPRGPPASTAGRFLVSSQRRVEELMRENHRLELLCITQEEAMKHSREEPISVGREPSSEVAGSSTKLGRLGRCKTPSLSRRSQATRSVAEGGDTTGTVDASQSLSISSRIVEAVQQLVDTATCVFPRLLSDVETPGDDVGRELDTTCAVFDFVVSNLSDWERLTRDSAELRRANTILSRTIAELEEKQETWRTTLLSIVKRLQTTEAEQRRSIQERDCRIDELQAQIDSLTADVTCAVEQRDQYLLRCEDLERSICCRLEEQLTERQEADRLQREYEVLRGELDSLCKSLPKEVTPPVTADGGNEGEQQARTELDVSKLQATIEAFMDERKAMQKRLDTLASTLTEVNERVFLLEEEKRQLSQQLKSKQNEVEDAHQELEELKRLPSSSAPAVAALSDETPMAAEKVDHAVGSHQRWFLRPVEYCEFDGKELSTPVVDVSSILRALDIDMVAFSDRNEHVRKPGLFFQIGCGIVKELELFNNLPATSLEKWKLFLLQIQDGFRDPVFYTADHAAECAQFFYALLLHSGMIPQMSHAELLAAVTAALCMEYGHPGVSGCLLSAAQDPAAAGIHSCILLEHRRLESLGEIFSQEQFFFCDDRLTTVSLLDDVKALLFPDGWHGDCSGVMHSCLKLLSSGPLRMESQSVRCQLVQLLLRLAKYAFCMRVFDVNDRYSGKWFQMMQRQAQFAAELGIYGFDLPHNTSTVADTQLLLMERTVLPLCRIVVQAFPSLYPCDVALRANYATWALRAGQHPTEGVVAEVCDPFLFPTTNQPHVEGSTQDATAADSIDLRGLDAAHRNAPQHVESGSLLVSTTSFIASQKEMLSVYEENVVLRGMLETLLVPVETLPASQGTAP
ncbi:hypothetical protein MOQ_001716 [Trypanosoma cruzi marinkellei]|uniref:PDEase domain-containing protein n=1 Tax=Trypanosoma cruzi marinkellei TaxID=85056 RepID=K2PAI3_TRYCR|nr:hypothetical protein MOQ_001716 [Trypanosoma cruzi marinkellei]